MPCVLRYPVDNSSHCCPEEEVRLGRYFELVAVMLPFQVLFLNKATTHRVQASSETFIAHPSLETTFCDKTLNKGPSKKDGVCGEKTDWANAAAARQHQSGVPTCLFMIFAYSTSAIATTIYTPPFSHPPPPPPAKALTARARCLRR